MPNFFFSTLYRYSSVWKLFQLFFFQVKSTKSFVKDILALSWRRLLTQQIHAKYFLDIQYYKLNVLNKELDNP